MQKSRSKQELEKCKSERWSSSHFVRSVSGIHSRWSPDKPGSIQASEPVSLVNVEEKLQTTGETDTPQVAYSEAVLKAVIKLQSIRRRVVIQNHYMNIVTESFPLHQKPWRFKLATFVCAWNVLYKFGMLFTLAYAFFLHYDEVGLVNKEPTGTMTGGVFTLKNWNDMQPCVKSNWKISSCQNITLPVQNETNEVSRDPSGKPIDGITFDRVLCAYNVPSSPYAIACIDQREKEMRFNKNEYRTPFHGSPHRLGVIWQLMIFGHAITAAILGTLVLPAIFETVMRTQIVHSGLSVKNAKQDQWCSVFSKCHDWYLKNPWIRKAAVYHHLLMVSSVSFGLLAGSMKLILKGFTLARWAPFWPNFEMSLQLYLQFVLLGSVCLDSIGQFFLLRIYGIKVPKKYHWQIYCLLASQGVTFLVCLIGVLIYTLLIEPAEPNVVYVIIFCGQLPLFCMYAGRNFVYWFRHGTYGKLACWQSQMNRNSAIMCHVSLATFGANLFLYLSYPLGVAILYLVCDVGLAVYIVGTERHLGAIMRRRNKTSDITQTLLRSASMRQMSNRNLDSPSNLQATEPSNDKK